MKGNTMATEREGSGPYADMRRRLLARLEELRADIARELRKVDDEQYGELAGAVADSGDKAVADLLVDVDLAEVSRDIAELREVEAALLRIAQGGYGICVDCGATIDRARLERIPSASRCIPCQERLEDREQIPRHRSL
jgi:RNA polymerase-binding transcription factor DksA